MPAAKADSDFIRQNYTATNRDCGDTIGLGGSAFFTLIVGAAAGYSPQCVLFVLNEDTGRGKTIAISGYPPFILWPGQAVTVLNENNVWQFTPQGQRWKLTDNTTFYVDQVSGNDSNDGLAPGAGAFETVSAAYGAIVNDLDFNSRTVTLQLSNAAWTNIGGFQTPWVGGGFLVVDGGGGTISGTGGNNTIDVVTNGGVLAGSIILQNMTITTSGGGNGILVFSGSVFIGSGMTFAAVSGSHLLVDGWKAKVILSSEYQASTKHWHDIGQVEVQLQPVTEKGL